MRLNFQSLTKQGAAGIEPGPPAKQVSILTLDHQSRSCSFSRSCTSWENPSLGKICKIIKPCSSDIMPDRVNEAFLLWKTKIQVAGDRVKGEPHLRKKPSFEKFWDTGPLFYWFQSYSMSLSIWRAPCVYGRVCAGHLHGWLVPLDKWNIQKIAILIYVQLTLSPMYL
jgi:hypothetical protein